MIQDIFAQCWKPKSVGGVSARNAYVKMEFLNEIIDQLPENMSIDLLGPWLGALAHLSAKRVIYTPYIEGKQSSPALLTNSEKQVFNAEFGGDLWVCANWLFSRFGDVSRISLHP